MNNRVMAAFAVCFGMLVSASEPVIVGKANVSDVLNLRVGGGLEHPIAGRVRGGTELVIHGMVGNWLAVELPSEVPLYLSEAKVNPDGKLVGDLNLRTGMGTNAPVLATLPKGTQVIRQDERRNGWVRVKLNDADRKKIRLYAAAFCVTYDPSRIDEQGKVIPTAEEKAALEAQTAEKKAEGEKQPASSGVKAEGKGDAKAVQPVKPGEKIELTGIVSRWKYSSSKDTDYALLDVPDGFNQAFICDGDGSRLASLTGKKVKISGESVGRSGNNGAVIVKVLSIAEIPAR